MMIASNEQIESGIRVGIADTGERNINCKIGFMVDGEFKEIGQPINPIELTIDEEEFDVEKFRRSFEIEIKIDEKERRKIMRALFGNAFSNNYKRFHHMPMRRKMRNANRIKRS